MHVFFFHFIIQFRFIKCFPCAVRDSASVRMGRIEQTEFCQNWQRLSIMWWSSESEKHAVRLRNHPITRNSELLSDAAAMVHFLTDGPEFKLTDFCILTDSAGSTKSWVKWLCATICLLFRKIGYTGIGQNEFWVHRASGALATLGQTASYAQSINFT